MGQLIISTRSSVLAKHRYCYEARPQHHQWQKVHLRYGTVLTLQLKADITSTVFFSFFFKGKPLKHCSSIESLFKKQIWKKNLIITLKEYCWLCYSVSKSILLGCSWKDQVIINKLSCKLNDKAISVFFWIWHRSLLFLVSRFCQVREKLAVIFQVCICQLISYPRS